MSAIPLTNHAPRPTSLTALTQLAAPERWAGALTSSDVSSEATVSDTSSRTLSDYHFGSEEAQHGLRRFS